MPWAQDESSSSVETRERCRELLEMAGFRELDEDRTAEVAAIGPPPAHALNPGDLFGADFAELIGNNIAAMAAGNLAPVPMLAVAA